MIPYLKPRSPIILASLHVLLLCLIVSSCLVALSRRATSFCCFILLLCLILLLHLALLLHFAVCPIVSHLALLFYAPSSFASPCCFTSCHTLLFPFCILLLPLTLLLPTICLIVLLPILPYCFFWLTSLLHVFKVPIVIPSCCFVSHFTLLLALCQLIPQYLGHFNTCSSNNYLILKFSFQQMEYSLIFTNILHNIFWFGRNNFWKFQEF